MTKLEEGEIQIHTENIFPIIKKAVYSDHEIFLRELVSNSVDAINKRRMASFAGDCKDLDKPEINIKINREENTITISDNGIGMTDDEIKKYINQVAFSSAEEFLEKYKGNEGGFIGHFGLGFYSSFMVAKKVELISKSAKDASKAYKWECDGSPRFTLVESNRDQEGTDVILYLMEEENEYIEPSRIKTLIKKYCDFMPIEVSFEGEVINKRNPPWRKSQKELKDEDYVELYKYLYPFQGEPLLWIHLNTDYPYNLQGILYFPQITGRADWESGEIKLYCNQVFVSDSIKEVVPRYLLPLRGVIDSPDIPLNVSRSALQSDRRVKSIGSFISKKVADRLKEIKSENPDFYLQIWDSLAPFVKIGAMEDDKFAEQVDELILFESLSETRNEQQAKGLLTKDNKSFTTIKNYIQRSANSENRILYYTDELSQASALAIWKSQGAEILKADTVIDTQFIQWIESKNNDYKFQRVDAELDEELKEDSKEITDKDGETQSEIIAKIIREALDDDKVTIKVKSLQGKASPPAMILLPEQMRRINDIGALMEQRLPGLPDYHVLLINKSHPLVQGLLDIKSTNLIIPKSDESPEEDLGKNIAKHLYDLARLGVGGLNPNEIPTFQSRSANLMARLITKAT